jgi:cell division transport system permease protein
LRAQFVLSEVGIGLRRNLTMTIATVITVGVALSLLGVGYFMYRQVSLMKGYWYGKIDVSVFLDQNVTQAQRDTILHDLETLPGVERVYYESQAQAYQRFKQEFASSPDLVNNTPESALPESYRVKLYNPQRFDIVTSAMANEPGVQDVVTQSTVLGKFFKMMNGLQTASWIAAAVGLLASVLLVYNATRVSAFSRRRETGIMRLVGASNAYIRLPFVLEGALTGFVGGLIAAAGLAALKVLLIDHTLAPSLSRVISFIGWDVYWVAAVAIVALGVVMTSLASAATLSRHLSV